ncbi:MAG: hypothetical protein HQL43_04475 [Alphaproteobacteria bacterium]|nr:hypothetical protein [Alphaproteobacteria bacterium]
MIRLVTVVWLVLALGGGVGLYLLKHEVQAMEARLTDMRRQTYADQQSIHVLKAEWTYLNEPARLKGLAQRYLGMEPMSATQVAMIGDLPRREAIGPQMPLPSGDPIPPPALVPSRDRAKMVPAAAMPPRLVPVPAQGTILKPPQKQATPPPTRGPALAGSARPTPELAEAR